MLTVGQIMAVPFDNFNEYVLEGQAEVECVLTISKLRDERDILSSGQPSITAQGTTRLILRAKGYNVR